MSAPTGFRIPKTVSGKDVVVSSFSQHPVVNPLIGFGLFLYLPRPISKVNWENPPPARRRWMNWPFTSPASTLAGEPGQSTACLSADGGG